MPHGYSLRLKDLVQLLLRKDKKFAFQNGAHKVFNPKEAKYIDKTEKSVGEKELM